MGGTLVLLVRLVISMAVVMGVMAVAARVLRHRQGFSVAPTERRPGLVGRAKRSDRPTRARKAKQAPAIDVVFRRPLAKGANIALVQAGGRQYLVGVTEQSVNLLTELGPATGLGAQEHGAGLGDEPGPNDEAPANKVSVASGGLSVIEGGGRLGDWQQAGRTPASLSGPVSPGQPATAWKLAIDSLRERTVRR